MNNIMIYASEFIIPLVFFVVICFALMKGTDIFGDFIEGVKEGMEVTFSILPTLIGLMVAVGIMSASGGLDMLGNAISPVADLLHFEAKLIPVILVKMFSSSAATGLLLDIYKSYGPDSYIGVLASVIMSSSETIFYTVSVYLGSLGIKKSRYIIPGAVIATLAGIIGSVLILKLYM